MAMRAESSTATAFRMGMNSWGGTNSRDPADTRQASIRAVDGHLRVQPLPAFSGRTCRMSGTSRLVSENGEPSVWSAVDAVTAPETGRNRFCDSRQGRRRRERAVHQFAGRVQ